MNPITMKTEVLAPPKIIRNQQVIHCDEALLRKMPI
jgi:hypothetical protein